MRRSVATMCVAIAACAGLAQASAAQQLAPPSAAVPFSMTLSNNTPLSFGMDVAATSRALGQPLQYVRGGPGNEIYLALRNNGGSGLINHHHRLFLQFRQGRLAGWKGDWGENWMWQ